MPLLMKSATCLGVLAFALGYASGTSLSARFTSRDDLIAAYSAAGIDYSSGDSVQLGLLKTLPTVLALVSSIMIVFSIRSRQGRLPAVPTTVAILISGAGLVVFVNPLSNSRYTAFSALLAILLALIPLNTASKKALLCFGLTVGLLVLYPASAAFKNSSTAQQTGVGAESFTTVDFDGMQQTANALYYVDTRGFTYGSITASAAFFFIPRSIWESKSLPSSYLTTENRGYGPLNLSQPLWSEAYMEGGLVAVAALFFLLGRVSRRLDQRFEARSLNSCVVIAAAGLQSGFIRGPMGAQIVLFACTLALTAALSKLCSGADYESHLSEAQPLLVGEEAPWRR